ILLTADPLQEALFLCRLFKSRAYGLGRTGLVLILYGILIFLLRIVLIGWQRLRLRADVTAAIEIVISLGTHAHVFTFSTWRSFFNHLQYIGAVYFVVELFGPCELRISLNVERLISINVIEDCFPDG